MLHMESSSRFYQGVILIFIVNLLSVTLPLFQVEINLNRKLALALGFRILLIASGVFLLTTMILTYLRNRGTVIRFLMLSLTFYLLSFISEYFFIVAINSDISLLYQNFILMSLFIAISLGSLFYTAFIVRVTDPERSTRILWLPILYIGVLLGYFILGDPNLVLRSYNPSIGYYQISLVLHPFIVLMNVVNYSYMGSYSILQTVVRARMGEGYRRKHYIVTTGIIGTFFGIGIIYNIGYSLRRDTLSYIYLDFFVPLYIFVFTILLFTPYLSDTKLVRFFALRVEHFYIVGEDGLPYLSIDFEMSHQMSDEMLVSAAISAIQSIMYDIGMGFSPLRKIELEERKILFYGNNQYIYALVTREVTNFLEDLILNVGLELDKVLTELPKEMIALDERVAQVISDHFGVL